MSQNHFLSQLLTLQADGTGAISAPRNWQKSALLQVRTKLDETAEEVASDVLQGPELKTRGRWHFFLGSPGNGKSAATGYIAELLRQRDCTLEYESSEGRKSLSELEPGEIPYLIKVYEPGNNFETVWIAQDASVVRDPWSKNLDPASDLIALLSKAWEKGVSLIVCANRGVVESAARSQAHRGKDWFDALSHVVADREFEVKPFPRGRTGKPRFLNVKITVESLDARSLLLGSQVFANLIDKAVEHEGWTTCSDCAVRNLCPFRANRDWLSDDEGKAVVLKALSHAELLSGQTIVLREAVAFLSIVLAGCPRDYSEGVNGPCEWVAERAAAQDLFGLASRRLYMIMFSAHLPRAAEETERAREQQHEGLLKLRDRLRLNGSDNSQRACRHLSHLLTGDRSPNDAISTDIGLGHLLGRQGVFQKLDPIRARLPEEFFGRWHPLQFQLRDPLHTALEDEMKASWATMYLQIEESTVNAREMLQCLSRWSTAFTVRLGGLVDRHLNMQQSLSQLVDLISGDEQTFQVLSRNLEKFLPTILSKTDDNTLHISLNEHVELTGHWVNNQLRPRVHPDAQRGQLGLLVRFGENGQQLIPAEVFHWLDQRVRNGLSLQCFPRQLLETAENYLIRIATTSSYSLTPDDVELRVSSTAGGSISIERRNGHVFVEVLN